MPISLTVAASADDASETAGTVSITANPLANCDTSGVWNAWRFTDVTIPAGATITQAYLTVRMTSGTLDEPDVTIYGLDVAAPAVFTTAASSISSRTRTTASVNWSNTNAGTGAVNTADISTIIQELVDSYAPYSSGVLGFAMTTRAADSARDTSVTSYDGSTSNCASLLVVFTLRPSVSDAVSVSDTPTVAVVSNDRSVNVSETVGVVDYPSYYQDDILVSESVGVFIDTGGTSNVNKSESITVTESVSVTVDAPQVSKSETIGTAELVAAQIQTRVNVADALGVTEAATPSIVTQVNKSEVIGVTDTDAVTVSAPQINKSEVIGITETVTTQIQTLVSVSDAIGVTESVSTLVGTPQINKSETVTLSEAVSATVSAPQISKSETITLTEAVNIAVVAAGARTVSVSETIGTAETVTVATASLAINKTETIGTSDTVTVATASFAVNKSETIGTSDTVTIFIPNSLTINVSESIGIADVPSATVVSAGARTVSVSETIGTGEAITVATATLAVNKSETIGTSEARQIGMVSLTIQVQEDIGLAEQLFGSLLVSFSVNDGINVTDIGLAELFTSYNVNVQETISVAESLMDVRVLERKSLFFRKYIQTQQQGDKYRNMR